MTEANKSFFIFPITNVSLFPRTTKPINVFEPKYIKMVHESIYQKVPIAICFVPENSNEIRPVAGFAIPKIVETQNDAMLVFMSAHAKVRLNFTTLFYDENELAIAEGEVIKEDLILDESLKSKYMSLSESLAYWIRQNIPDTNQREIFIRGLIGPEEVISAFAAYLIYDHDMQYEILEMDSLANQIKFLYRLLESGRFQHT